MIVGSVSIVSARKNMGLPEPSTMKRILAGAIDMHVHVGPEIIPRAFDVLDLVEQMRELGMGGYVAKSNSQCTAGETYVVNKLFHDVEGEWVAAFGAITLNYSVGGLNPVAINVAANLGTPFKYAQFKCVWFPTTSSIATMKFQQLEAGKTLGGTMPVGPRTAYTTSQKIFGGTGKGIEIVKPNGEIVPDVEAVIHAIAENNLILATGHISEDETFAVVDGAKSLGVKKIISTHPRFPVERLIELANKGVIIEQTYTPPVFASGAEGNLAAKIANISKIGAERMIVTTDSGIRDGWWDNMAVAWKKIVETLLEGGITERQIITMIKTNPKRLLDLE